MAAHTSTSEGKDFSEFAVREDGYTDALRAFGMPVVYGLDKPVTAVTGHALRSLTDQEIKDLFSRGVLLDGKALES
ncbi:MAG: hypothetical protein ACYTFY_14515, partial [Planctomycetota bacterium]